MLASRAAAAAVVVCEFPALSSKVAMLGGCVPTSSDELLVGSSEMVLEEASEMSEGLLMAELAFKKDVDAGNWVSKDVEELIKRLDIL